MKKTISLISSLSVTLLFGQDVCGFDHLHHQWKSKNVHQEEVRKTDLKEFYKNQELSSKTLSKALLGNTIPFLPYNGPIYEVPIVVHIIETSYKSWQVTEEEMKISDEQIKKWINNTNTILATTYGNGFPKEGGGLNDGTVIPFKLVLAKRTVDGLPTTGINRVNGDIYPYYGADGVRYQILPEGRGASVEEIKAIAPHWREDLYLNLYIVVGIDGAKKEAGLTGFAGLPNYGNDSYDIFIKVASAKKKNDITLAHEFGHTLGLLHTYSGGSENQCPTNTGNCTKDDDGICDTEPSKSWPKKINASTGEIATPTNDDYNECSGKNFQGEQYNIMNYSYDRFKFTPGQRDWALNQFLKYRSSLTRSRGGEAVTEKNTVTVINALCSRTPQRLIPNATPDKITVNLGTINNTSTSNNVYIDYIKIAHQYKNVFTEVLDSEASNITIKGLKGLNINAWIDYNDNGIFENNEAIVNNIIPNNGVLNVSFTPPPSAIKDKFLRLRVRSDDFKGNACDDLEFGQIQDYAVRIVSEFTPPISDDETSPESNIYTSRIGINTLSPQASLDVRETKLSNLKDEDKVKAQGIVLPNFTTEERNTFKKVKNGIIIYNITNQCVEIYQDGQWICL